MCKTIKQRRVWSEYLLLKRGQAGDDQKTMQRLIKDFCEEKTYSKLSPAKDEQAWTPFVAVLFYSMTELHTTTEHLDAFRVTSITIEFDRDFI